MHGQTLIKFSQNFIISDRVHKRAAKFLNNINELGWETLAQRRMIARICALFKAYTGRWAWKAIDDILLKPCYLSSEDHTQKIRTRKERTYVGKHSFVNISIKSWNQLLAGLLATFPCQITRLERGLRM